MAKKKNEFTLEREEWERFQRIGAKEIAPYFRKALNDTLIPVINFVERFGVNALQMSMPIDPNVWNNAYLQAYNKLGMKSARKQYYYMRRMDGLLEEKASAIEIFVDVWSSLLRDYAINYTNLMASQLNATTIEMINKALGETTILGLDWDNSIRLFIKNIKGEFKKRAGVISRTESTTISNLGKAISARSYIDSVGGQGYKVWLGRNDNRERQTHIDENNTIIPIDDLHIVGGESCERPGDINLSAKERINCRCTESYLSQNRYLYFERRGRIVNGKLLGASGNRNS